MRRLWIFSVEYSPVPTPLILAESAAAAIPTLTTVCDGVDCGAILGKYRQPYPSALMSNSAKAGVTDVLFSRTSRGVVMETRHLTRVSGTTLPCMVQRLQVQRAHRSDMALLVSERSGEIAVLGSCWSAVIREDAELVESALTGRQYYSLVF